MRPVIFGLDHAIDRSRTVLARYQGNEAGELELLDVRNLDQVFAEYSAARLIAFLADCPVPAVKVPELLSLAERDLLLGGGVTENVGLLGLTPKVVICDEIDAHRAHAHPHRGKRRRQWR